MKILKINILIITMLLFNTVLADAPYLINEETGEYLGTLDANPYAEDSVNNPYGEYGSEYSEQSINNPYGQYGSPYSNDSVNNPYGTNAPAIYGSE